MLTPSQHKYLVTNVLPKGMYMDVTEIIAVFQGHLRSKLPQV